MEHHAVRSLWIRSADGAALEEREALEVHEGKGIVGDHAYAGKRHVTLVFEEDWRDAANELGLDVPPTVRRANVILSGADGLALVGKKVRMGDILLEIHGETPPCAAMNKGAPGMLKALIPHGRAGVWGRVLEGGSVRRNDRLTVESAG